MKVVTDINSLTGVGIEYLVDIHGSTVMAFTDGQLVYKS